MDLYKHTYVYRSVARAVAILKKMLSVAVSGDSATTQAERRGFQRLPVRRRKQLACKRLARVVLQCHQCPLHEYS